MIKKLIEFLKELNDKDADELWLYLDGNPEAIEEMTMVIAESHPNIK
jgi:hypothetical protein